MKRKRRRGKERRPLVRQRREIAGYTVDPAALQVLLEQAISQCRDTQTQLDRVTDMAVGSLLRQGIPVPRALVDQVVRRVVDGYTPPVGLMGLPGIRAFLDDDREGNQ